MPKLKKAKNDEGHMEVTKTAILSIAIAWFFYYLVITGRGIILIGIRDYWSYVIRSDKRKMNVSYFLFAWGVLRILGPSFNTLEITPELNFVIDIALLPPLFKLFAPPQVLLLHTFNADNKKFSRKLNWTVAIGNVISLSPPLPRISNKAIKTLSKMASNDVDSGLEAKLCTEENWRSTVEKYIEMAEVIILDISFIGKGVIEEMKMLTKKKKDLKKVIIIYRDIHHDAKGINAIPQGLKEAPLLSYKDIGFFTEGRILDRNFRKEINRRSKLLLNEWIVLSLTIGLCVLIFVEHSLN